MTHILSAKDTLFLCQQVFNISDHWLINSLFLSLSLSLYIYIYMYIYPQTQCFVTTHQLGKTYETLQTRIETRILRQLCILPQSQWQPQRKQGNLTYTYYFSFVYIYASRLPECSICEKSFAFEIANLLLKLENFEFQWDVVQNGAPCIIHNLS